MQKNRPFILLTLICVLGSIYHASFFHLNDVLKVADSFAYIQMGHFFQELSQEGFGNGGLVLHTLFF